MSGEVVEVKVVTVTDSDYCARETLYINGRRVMSAGPLWECPEDATLERDMLGASNFTFLLEKFLIEHKGKKVRFVYEEGDENND